MKSKFLTLSLLIAGILLLVLNMGVWINGVFINRGDGMDLILAVPLLFLGAVSLLGWYKNRQSPPPAKQQQWKFILRVLLINYILLYGLYMAQDFMYSDPIDFLTIPGVLFPVLLGLFLAGTILSWKWELYAGIFFLIWYGVVIWGTFGFFEFYNRGPHFLFGVVILLQGIFYLNYHFRIRPKRSLGKEGGE
ncbi:MAG TPA: hypothetical protein PK711_05020 [Bacteroidales bacterium]|nr:hypothetical protein [Bacteroidales bacterium]HRZ21001.1 hypothetical protein [Bacteroidales bacterium]